MSERPAGRPLLLVDVDGVLNPWGGGELPAGLGFRAGGVPVVSCRSGA